MPGTLGGFHARYANIAVFQFCFWGMFWGFYSGCSTRPMLMRADYMLGAFIEPGVTQRANAMKTDRK